MGTFNRHLRTLEHTAPTRFRAANSRQPRQMGTIAPFRPATSAGLGPMTDPRRVRPPSGPARRRAATQKRRRDVFFALLAGVIGSLVLGIIPGLHVMLYFQGLFDVLLVGYVAALVSMKNRAVERDTKLAYLSSAAPRRQGTTPARHAPTRAYGGEGYAYEASSGYHDDTYGDGYSYGDLAIRRAAN